MLTWIMASALLAGCKSGKDVAKRIGLVPNATSNQVTVPKVSVATVLAKDDGKPPLLLIIDASGTARIAAAKTWAELDAHKLRIAAKAAELRILDKLVREAYLLKRDPLVTVASWDLPEDLDIAPRAVDDTTKPIVIHQDDPPPPPEDDDGEYTEDPQHARQQAIKQARAAGIFDSPDRSAGLWMPSLDADAMRATPLDADSTPWRLAQAEGLVVKDGKLEPLYAMIVIAPTAKATALIEAVRDTDSAIAVSFDHKIRPLHLQFAPHGTGVPEQSYWLEVRVSAKQIVVEAVPDKPIEVTTLDQIGTAMQQARAGRDGEPGAVDVLVAPDVDAQRLIDVMVAVDLTGAPVIGIGLAPSTEELAPRGHPHLAVQLSIGAPSVQGDLDKAVIRRTLKRVRPKISSCYEKALRLAPTLEGLVLVEFLIRNDGSVASSAVSGVSSEIASCVANVIKSVAFPKPAAGSVKVNCPFVFRPVNN